jgi:hypothetical protein
VKEWEKQGGDIAKMYPRAQELDDSLKGAVGETFRFLLLRLCDNMCDWIRWGDPAGIVAHSERLLGAIRTARAGKQDWEFREPLYVMERFLSREGG